MFDVIAVSETWIKESVSSYTVLENYQMCHTLRQNKKGGGVAIYIKNNFYFDKIYVLSTNIEDVMEIVTVEKNNTDIVNEISKFLTNIGKEIANNIPNITSKTINDYLRNKNDHSMYLQTTDDKEIHNLVSQFSSRRSMNHHDIYMYCIKYIIASITKPLMHICNLSFCTGIFPDEMKIARVMPIFKNKIELKN